MRLFCKPCALQPSHTGLLWHRLDDCRSRTWPCGQRGPPGSAGVAPWKSMSSSSNFQAGPSSPGAKSTTPPVEGLSAQLTSARPSNSVRTRVVSDRQAAAMRGERPSDDRTTSGLAPAFRSASATLPCAPSGRLSGGCTEPCVHPSSSAANNGGVPDGSEAVTSALQRMSSSTISAAPTRAAPYSGDIGTPSSPKGSARASNNTVTMEEYAAPLPCDLLAVACSPNAKPQLEAKCIDRPVGEARATSIACTTARCPA
mmetsp:Transcript_174097/g.558196  ORF Transcript_174097/g.558196 Transcript_174097/m.558196 type:complete len:257 (-) Transcript_174097:3706-4476(-)